ncbi:sigma-70 family RNA polymerase sigma factor [Cryptosporangium phraense]|uniref:Sigma-70 family RNA polymerase sigma factor n=2 Tax=Cryptosporangium phraense TaxID=2593070 RepID=A0A545AGS5_9ACTN|nr:sigma-70 family RNA polymerase sigma factor [Cryptosporangium phraense]
MPLGTELDLSDLRSALTDLRNRTGLRSAGLGLGLRCLAGRHGGSALPWSRSAGGAHAAPSGAHALPDLPAQPDTEAPAPEPEPHPADPRRPARPSSRALRNPAPRRPADDDETTGSTTVVGHPPVHGHAAGNAPPGHVPAPTRGHRGRAPDRDTERDTDRPSDDGEDVWRLVRLAQAGDTEAFARIYDRYFDTVYRYISYRIGSRSVAEDLTSEVWLRALRRIGSVTWQGRDLGAWLVTIARNLIADHYKSARARLEVTTADMRDADDEDHGPEGRPEAEVLARLDNATLLEAVRRLNPEQQECITLRFLQGLSVTETAQIMGKNDGAIKALQYRAVRTLGRLLPEGFTL